MWEKIKAWVRAEIDAALAKYHAEYHAHSPGVGQKIQELKDAADAAHAELTGEKPPAPAPADTSKSAGQDASKAK